MMLYLHGLSYSVEFGLVFLTFCISFDFLFHFLEGNLHSFHPTYLRYPTPSPRPLGRSGSSRFAYLPRVNYFLLSNYYLIVTYLIFLRQPCFPSSF